MAIYYIDLYNGNDTAAGTSWATAWKTLNAGPTAPRIAPGDEIRISKTPDPAGIGNATWTNASKVITLASALTQTVENCEAVWTASTNVTAARVTTMKQGSYAAQLAVATAFTTGKVGYKAIGSSLNLSPYQTLSFWFRTTVALAASALRVCLCSDTAGDTVVDSFVIPAIPAAGRFIPLTIDRTGGGNLGAAIQSVAIYADTDPGTPSIIIDNIIACTAGGLNLQSLISKNGAAQGGTGAYYAIQSIVGTSVLIDTDTNTAATAGLGFFGDTETVATYIRETFKTAMAASSTAIVNTFNDNGLNNSIISYKFGFQIGTDLQNGETHFDGLCGFGMGFEIPGRRFILLEKFAAYRYYYALRLNNAACYNIIDCSNLNNNQLSGFRTEINSRFNQFKAGSINNNNSHGMSLYTAYDNVIYFDEINGNAGSAFNLQSTYKNYIYAGHAYYNGVIAVSQSGLNFENHIYDIEIKSNFIAVGSATGTLFLQRAKILNSLGIILNSESMDVFSFDEEGLANNHRVYHSYASSIWQSEIKYNEIGAWRIQLHDAIRDEWWPAELKIAEVAFIANRQVTITAVVKKAHATNVNARLAIEQNVSLGIEATAAIAPDTTEWTEVSLTFTPTRSGVTAVFFRVYLAATGSGGAYVAPIQITQV